MSKTLGQTDRRVSYFPILHLYYVPTWNSEDSQRAGRSRNRILVRKYFLHPSRLALMSSQLRVKMGPGISRGQNGQGEVLGADHLFPSGAKIWNVYELYHRFVSMPAEACNGVTFTFTCLECMTIVGDFFLPKQGSRNSLHEISSSYSSSIGATAQCALWSVEQCPI
jgi:hypothetical protein